MTSTYSLTVYPNTLATIAVRYARSAGSFSATNARTPTFCNPTAFITPLGVSHIRGGGASFIGWMERPLPLCPQDDRGPPGEQTQFRSQMCRGQRGQDWKGAKRPHSRSGQLPPAWRVV